MSIQERTLEELAPFFVVSVHHSSQRATTNAAAHKKQREAFNDLGIQFKEVLGSWEGNQEMSFVVRAEPDHVRAFAEVQKVAKEFNQDAFMSVSKDMHCAMWVLANQSAAIFQYQPEANQELVGCSEESLDHFKGWTYDRENKKYHIAL